MQKARQVKHAKFQSGGGRRTRTHAGVSQRIYSPPIHVDFSKENRSMSQLCRAAAFPCGISKLRQPKSGRGETLRWHQARRTRDDGLAPGSKIDSNEVARLIDEQRPRRLPSSIITACSFVTSPDPEPTSCAQSSPSAMHAVMVPGPPRFVGGNLTDRRRQQCRPRQWLTGRRLCFCWRGQF